ncbi:MAG: Sua5/YciO/YrdC/YwlC family protein, partial [Candidatus Omnitrophica bacterium]|nr:Sua5/YciO/YrdC/YwlC family protein [Candidatus Omnitrophota bacterium]
MSAKIVKTDSLNPDAAILKEAAEILAGGGLVIMPTETVYGVGASILDEKALDKLSAIKNR